MGNNICSSCTASPELSGGLSPVGGPKPVYGAADDVRVSATSKAATTAAAAELEVKQPSATEVKVKVNGCQGNSQPGFASQPTIEKASEDTGTCMVAQCHDVEVVSQSDISMSHVTPSHVTHATDITNQQHTPQQHATVITRDITQQPPSNATNADITEINHHADIPNGADFTDNTDDTSQLQQLKPHDNGTAGVTECLPRDTSICTVDIDEYAQEYVQSLLFVITQVLYPLIIHPEGIINGENVTING